MGQSLNRWATDKVDRLGVFLGRNGICGLIRRIYKWTKMMVKDFLRFLRKQKSKWFGEKKKEQKLEEE